MGLFDFGDKAVIQEKALRISIGISQIEDEIRKSPTSATGELRGLAWAIKEEKEKMMQIANKLLPAARASIMVKYKGQTIHLYHFLEEIQPILIKVKELTGINML
jgi:hypothetical protein